MFYRLLFSFFLLISCTSCNYISSAENNNNQAIDTIIDFTKVDVSPSFKVCEKLLDEAKTNCFRINIKQYFIKKLRNLSLTADKQINEKIDVVLTVDEKGLVSLKELFLTDEIVVHFPEIESSINEMVKNIPKLSPALKRGIPVNTEYKLPIHIIVE